MKGVLYYLPLHFKESGTLHQKCILTCVSTSHPYHAGRVIPLVHLPPLLLNVRTMHCINVPTQLLQGLFPGSAVLCTVDVLLSDAVVRLIKFFILHLHF